MHDIDDVRDVWLKAIHNLESPDTMTGMDVTLDDGHRQVQVEEDILCDALEHELDDSDGDDFHCYHRWDK